MPKTGPMLVSEIHRLFKDRWLTQLGANDVEMGQMNGQPQQNDDVSLAQDALDVERAVKTLKTDNVTQIARLHQQTLSETDPEQRKRISRQLDALRAETNATYKNLVSRLNKLKGKPGAGSERNQPQIMRVQRVINAELQAFNDLQSKQRKAEAELIERQIRGVVNKGTTEQQIQEMVHEAVESGNQDIYAQAVRMPWIHLESNSRFRRLLTAPVLDKYVLY